MASVSMRSGRNRRRLVNEINVVPYIDVMLVLLVIFMVTAPMISTTVVDVPRAGAARGVQPDTFVQVTVRERGPFTVQLHDARGAAPRGGRNAAAPAGAGQAGDAAERQVDRNDRKALADAIRALRAAHDDAAAPGGLPVLIAAEKSVRYETVMDVMAELQKQDVERIALSLRAP